MRDFFSAHRDGKKALFRRVASRRDGPSRRAHAWLWQSYYPVLSRCGAVPYNSMVTSDIRSMSTRANKNNVRDGVWGCQDSRRFPSKPVSTGPRRVARRWGGANVRRVASRDGGEAQMSVASRRATGGVAAHACMKQSVLSIARSITQRIHDLKVHDVSPIDVHKRVSQNMRASRTILNISTPAVERRPHRSRHSILSCTGSSATAHRQPQ